MNVKKALSEETEVVKQLDVDKRAFKDNPTGRRPPSPPISTKSSFVFQPLDEYPTSSNSSFDDPDVWRPPSRDTSRRPGRGGQVGTRKSNQDSKWARGATTKTTSTTGRGAKAAGATSRTNSGARGSTPVKKGGASGKSSNTDAVVSFNFYGAFCWTTFSLSHFVVTRSYSYVLFIRLTQQNINYVYDPTEP